MIYSGPPSDWPAKLMRDYLEAVNKALLEDANVVLHFARKETRKMDVTEMLKKKFEEINRTVCPDRARVGLTRDELRAVDREISGLARENADLREEIEQLKFGRSLLGTPLAKRYAACTEENDKLTAQVRKLNERREEMRSLLQSIEFAVKSAKELYGE